MLRNVRQNPQVTLAVDDTREGDEVIAIEGTAELLDDPAVKPTLRAYAGKHTDQLQAMAGRRHR